MLTKAQLQRLRGLRDKQNREAEGVFVIEGEKVVGELLAAGFVFEEIYATEQWTAPVTAAKDAPPSARAPRPQIIPVTTTEMARASHLPTPTSVLALGRIRRTPLAADALARGLTLALDGVQDPGNVGTLLRIADWFALDRVLLSPDCADLFSPKVINASKGSFARVAAHRVDLAEIFATTPKRVPILGCDLSGEDVHGLKPRRDAVIVIGSEGRGISSALRPLVTNFITIPRYGGAESLNAGVAAAIVCDNLRRVVG